MWLIYANGRYARVLPGANEPEDEPVLGGKYSLAFDIEYARSTLILTSAVTDAFASALTWNEGPRVKTLERG